jgi:hypothetical protein
VMLDQLKLALEAGAAAIRRKDDENTRGTLKLNEGMDVLRGTGGQRHQECKRELQHGVMLLKVIDLPVCVAP